jgi:hypothetical protein
VLIRIIRTAQLAAVLICSVPLALATEEPPMKPSRLERTSFQTAGPCRPQTDIKSDVAIVYGINESLPSRIASWRERGYRIHLMTGIAWGNYQDYLYGRFDGQQHLDDAQVDRNGEKVSHGGDVYYMVPTEPYARMISERVKQAVDVGVLAIHLEEPEFWVRSGYSESFKREWQAFYGEPWQPPHSSPEAQYKASKLKYYLYRRALDTVFSAAKQHARSKGRDVRCYVPTHSLLNYSHWGIVSPESSLAQLDSCDGYIGQVWTGTARTPNLYRGIARERTFETAFLEYGALNNMVQATGKRMWFLADPVEDDPNHDWDDYRANYECTVIASLFFPDVWRYEVMPWPDRVWMGRYPESRGLQNRAPIPSDYATELLTVINALNDMRQSRVEWDCGTRGIGICVSDTMMFQRGEPSPADPNNFYGLALPLLKRGIPIAPVQLENMTRRGYLRPYRALVLSYDFMKPPSEAAHRALVRWVKAGGVLLYVGDGTDPYRQVPEWWNTGGLSYAGPEEHLFHALGFDRWPVEGAHKVGKGIFAVLKRKPVSLALSSSGDEGLVTPLRRAFAARYGPRAWREQNYLLLRRGPYVIAAVLDESTSDRPLVLRGRFVDLLDPKLPVLTTKKVATGQRALLYDLDRAPEAPAVIASASRIFDVRRSEGRIAFRSGGPANTQCVTRLILPRKPNLLSVHLGRQRLPFESAWHSASHTLVIKHANSPDSPSVVITY